jgi:WD40 repeat protein
MDSQFDRALLLGAQAHNIADTREARSALLLGQLAQPLLTTHLSGHSGSVTSVAYSPDGTTLASGGSDGTIILWDVASRTPLGEPLTRHADQVLSVAYSPDGTTLASGGSDGTIILWDVASREPLGAPLSGHSGSVTSVAYSPDGTTLASGGSDGTIILWDVDPASWLERSCGRANRNLNADEWQQYLPGEPYDLTCDALPPGEGIDPAR